MGIPQSKNIDVGDLVIGMPPNIFTPTYIAEFWNSKVSKKLFIVYKIRDEMEYVFARTINGEEVEGPADRFHIVRKGTAKKKQFFELLGLI